ncbi:hypothetical protein C8J57DRAFT_1466353 [Mycena rebaudengoi]|nr:hypothetical protein C8J57DRAFT_1466353 [Mycena rebaudengoi]
MPNRFICAPMYAYASPGSAGFVMSAGGVRGGAGKGGDVQRVGGREDEEGKQGAKRRPEKSGARPGCWENERDVLRGVAQSGAGVADSAQKPADWSGIVGALLQRGDALLLPVLLTHDPGWWRTQCVQPLMPPPRDDEEQQGSTRTSRSCSPSTFQLLFQGSSRHVHRVGRRVCCASSGDEDRNRCMQRVPASMHGYLAVIHGGPAPLQPDVSSRGLRQDSKYL